LRIRQDPGILEIFWSGSEEWRSRGRFTKLQGFPKEERFGLISQMRRAAVSIPSNIAEGQARHSTGEFVQFISHAEGSLAELETQLRLSVELTFCQQHQAHSTLEAMEDLRKKLNALRRRLVTRH